MKIQLSSLSALPLKTYRNWAGRKLYRPELYEKLFKFWTKKGKARRIYLPVGKSAKPHNTTGRDSIAKYLESKGFMIEDYLIGMAVHKDTGRVTKIGKILSKGKQDDLKRIFDNDKSRQAQSSRDLYVVISRHPYDIAGMSTGRNWTSCLNLHDGSNSVYVQHDVPAGHLVAYLIEGSDKNINRPLARVRLLRYEDKENPKKFILHRQPKVYGNPSANFTTTVDAWLDKINPKDAEGLFCLKDVGTYTDGMGTHLKIVDETSKIDYDSGFDTEYKFKTRELALDYLEHNLYKGKSLDDVIGSSLITSEDVFNILDKVPKKDLHIVMDYAMQVASSIKAGSIISRIYNKFNGGAKGNAILRVALKNPSISVQQFEDLFKSIDNLDDFTDTQVFQYLTTNAIDAIEKLRPGLIWSKQSVLPTHDYRPRHLSSFVDYLTDRQYVQMLMREDLNLSVAKVLIDKYLKKPVQTGTVLGLILNSAAFKTYPDKVKTEIAVYVATNYGSTLAIKNLKKDPKIIKELAISLKEGGAEDSKLYPAIVALENVSWGLKTFGASVAIHATLSADSEFLEPSDLKLLLDAKSLLTEDSSIVLDLLSKVKGRRESSLNREAYIASSADMLESLVDVEVLNVAMEVSAPEELQALYLRDSLERYLENHVYSGKGYGINLHEATDDVLATIVSVQGSLDLMTPKQVANLVHKNSDTLIPEDAEDAVRYYAETDNFEEFLIELSKFSDEIGDDIYDVLEEIVAESFPELTHLLERITHSY